MRNIEVPKPGITLKRISINGLSIPIKLNVHLQDKAYLWWIRISCTNKYRRRTTAAEAPSLAFLLKSQNHHLQGERRGARQVSGSRLSAKAAIDMPKARSKISRKRQWDSQKRPKNRKSHCRNWKNQGQDRELQPFFQNHHKMSNEKTLLQDHFI